MAYSVWTLISTQAIAVASRSRRIIPTLSLTNQTYRTSRTECFKIAEQCSWATRLWCKNGGSRAVAGAGDATSRRWRLKPRPDCLVLILETRRVQYKERASPMRRRRNDGGVDAASAVRPATTVGRGGRAVALGQARGQAQGQAVAAGTSSRLSLLMLCGRVSCHVRAAGRDCEAYLLLFL